LFRQVRTALGSLIQWMPVSLALQLLYEKKVKKCGVNFFIRRTYSVRRWLVVWLLELRRHRH
jgi:hypothetical protein